MPVATAHVDTFAAANLPPVESWPDLIFDRPEFQYPDRLNCGAALLDDAVAAGHGARIAIRAPGLVWRYQDLLGHANRIARVLVEDMGLVPGNRVLLHGPNTPMLAASWFAVMKAGGIAVTTMPLLRARELAPIVEKAQISHALCDYRLADEISAAKDAAPVLRNIAWFGPGGDLEARIASKPDDFSNCETAATDTALIGFTSGTTGGPKGTMHFHRDVMAICDAFPRSTLKPEADDLFCGSPPLGFTFGLGGLLLFPLRFGAATLLLEKASPDHLLDAIGEHHVSVLFTAPTAYRAMLDKLAKADISSLRRCVSAGEPMPAPTFDAWQAATGIRIIDGIGATEMLHIFISAADDAIRPGATGRPLPGYEARLIAADGTPVATGEVGRLAVRGPTGCRYLADERQHSYVQDGWNITGDAYRMDEDGYYWFVARTDDIILSAGYNISGPEVESTLLSHPAVAECAVVGAPDTERGHIVKAFIVLRPGEAAGGEQTRALQDFVKQRIAPYKYPRAIEYVEELPKTATGKVQRFRLRDNGALSTTHRETR